MSGDCLGCGLAEDLVARLALVLLLSLALGGVVELESLVDFLAGKVGVLSLLDLSLGHLGGGVLDVEAVNVVELHGLNLGLVSASARGDWALGEADVLVAFDILDALDWFLSVSLGLLGAIRRG